MLRLLHLVMWIAAQVVIRLRYRVRVEGWEPVRDLEGGTLVLPNHPGYIDPVIVLTMLWRRLRPRPMLAERLFASPLIGWLPRAMRAVKIPPLDQASTEARARADEAVREVAQGLNAGETHIMWPAGRVWDRGGFESIGAARGLTEILRAAPEANLVLVRTRGVWGSSFSVAYDGERPKLIKRLLRGFGALLANLWVFAPRRRVTLTLHPFERAQLPADLTRETVNPALEAWYNAGGPEEPTFVPYHFLFGKRHHEYPPLSPALEVDLSQIAPAVRAEVSAMVGRHVKREVDPDLDPETPLDALGLDSLDRMELAAEIEQRFQFGAAVIPTTIGELWGMASGLIEATPPAPPPRAWFAPRDASPLVFLGETIPEAFVARALADPKRVAAADDLSGAVTSERMLIGARLMAKRFRLLEASRVGLMMPASVAADVALFAIYLAGKLPVILNWTTGPANLEHAATVTEITHVVTSRRFIDRVGVEVPGTEYLFLEDLREDIGALEKLGVLLAIRLRKGHVRRSVPTVRPEDPAVVLFTSGSERAPKAVPLSHRNIISDIEMALEILRPTQADSLLGFLPAFHSFGLTVTVILPLLAGARVVHHPDPTDAKALARKCGLYRPTMIVGTPTFLSYLLDRAEPGELASLRLAVVGAEKCPDEVFTRVARAAPEAAILEGYGITECAPVVTVNALDDNRPGTIGKPLPGVDLRIVDPETYQPLDAPVGKRGMLLIAGPNVFDGYWAYDGPSPFREIDGKRYYISGDLVEQDAEGFLHFKGRLKRFLKAGGEMISLPALEEPFAARWPITPDGPRVAVEGIELPPSGRVIVLFTTEEVGLEEANAVLTDAGFRGVMRLDAVHRLDAIPVLGTGKTDYKVLRRRLQEAVTVGE